MLAVPSFCCTASCCSNGAAQKRCPFCLMFELGIHERPAQMDPAPGYPLATHPPPFITPRSSALPPRTTSCPFLCAAALPSLLLHSPLRPACHSPPITAFHVTFHPRACKLRCRGLNPRPCAVQAIYIYICCLPLLP